MDINQLRQAGFDDAEIGEYVAAESPKLREAGFSDDEIGQHFGTAAPQAQEPEGPAGPSAAAKTLALTTGVRSVQELAKLPEYVGRALPGPETEIGKKIAGVGDFARKQIFQGVGYAFPGLTGAEPEATREEAGRELAGKDVAVRKRAAAGFGREDEPPLLKPLSYENARYLAQTAAAVVSFLPSVVAAAGKPGELTKMAKEWIEPYRAMGRGDFMPMAETLAYNYAQPFFDMMILTGGIKVVKSGVVKGGKKISVTRARRQFTTDLKRTESLLKDKKITKEQAHQRVGEIMDDYGVTPEAYEVALERYETIRGALSEMAELKQPESLPVKIPVMKLIPEGGRRLLPPAQEFEIIKKKPKTITRKPLLEKVQAVKEGPRPKVLARRKGKVEPEVPREPPEPRGRPRAEKEPPPIEPKPAEKPVEVKPPDPEKSVKIGDSHKVMDIDDAIVADVRRIGGVDYELYNANRLKDRRGAVRVRDADSGEIVSVKSYKTYDQTESAYKALIESVKKGERPAPKAKPAEKLEVKAKEPWEMTFKEFMAQPHHPRTAIFHSNQFHRELIKESLKAGKPVPKEVLKEYPELTKGEVAPKLLQKRKQLQKKKDRLDEATERARVSDDPGTFVTGRSGISRVRQKRIAKQRDRAIDRGVEYVETVKELQRTEAKVKAAEKRPIREAAETEAFGRLERQFDTIEVGDKIDIGGNVPVLVVKKNKRTVVTEGGGKWRPREISNVIKKVSEKLTEEKGAITVGKKTELQKFRERKRKKVSPQEANAVRSWINDRRTGPLEKELEGVDKPELAGDSLREASSKEKTPSAVEQLVRDQEEFEGRGLKEKTADVWDKETLEVIEDSPLDQAATTYLETGDISKALDERISIGPELTLKEVMNQAPGIAALRKSGFYASKDFADYFWDAEKGMKHEDITPRTEMWSDPTRTLQAIQGGKFHGAATKYILHPTRKATLAKLRWSDVQKGEGAKILDKHGITNKAISKTVSDVIEMIDKEKAGLSVKELLKQEDIAAKLKGNSDKFNQRVVGAAKEFRPLLEEIRDIGNSARKQRNQPEIGYQKKYLSWIQARSLLAQHFGELKPLELKEGPPMPDFMQPNQAFNPHAQKRVSGGEWMKERRIEKIYGRYVDAMSRDIFDTDIVHSNKVHAKLLREMGYENAATAIETWTSENFAGTAPRITRFMKTLLPEKVRRVPLRIRAGLTKSVFPLNIKWNLGVQTSSVGLTYARYGAANTAWGLNYFFNSALKQAIHRNAYSAIVKKRYGGSAIYQDIAESLTKTKRLEASKFDTAHHYASYLTQVIEDALTGHAIAAAYRHGKGRGLKGRELWEYASEGGAKTQSMYNKADKPGLLRSSDVGAWFPFQTFAFEVFNTVREANLPGVRRVIGKTGAYTEFTPKMRNKLSMFGRWSAAMMVTNMVMDKLFAREPWEMSSFVPFSSVLLAFQRGFGGARHSLPIQYVEDWYQAAGPGGKFWKTGELKYLRKPITRYHILGGTQIERMLRGLEASIEGEVSDISGKRLYRVREDETLKSILLGPESTEGGQKYREKRGWK